MNSDLKLYSVQGVCDYLKICRPTFKLHVEKYLHPINIIGAKYNHEVFIQQDIDDYCDLKEEIKSKELVTINNVTGIKGQMGVGEEEFSKVLDSRGIKWLFHHQVLDKGTPCKKHNRNKAYIVDFYCPEIDVYYEVSCTRQAKEQSQRKIHEVQKVNPGLKITIVHPDGEEFGSREYDRSKFITVGDLSIKYSKSKPNIIEWLRCGNVEYSYPKHCKSLRIYKKKAAEKIIKERVACLKSKKVITVDGKKIRALRIKYKITLISLADFVGVNYFNIMSCETGRCIARRKELISFFSDFGKAEEIIKQNLGVLTSKHTGKNRFERYYPEIKKSQTT